MPERRRSPLRDRRLVALLVAETVSMTGSQMRWLALPWFVLATSGSAARTGLVMAASAAGVALLGIPGGSILERVGARRTMLLSDGLRVPLVLAIPLLHWAGGLSLGLLLALAFALGALAAPYFAAQRVLVPLLVGEDEAIVSRANALLQAATRGTMLAGPALGGVLIALVGSMSVLVATSAAHLLAFAVVAAFLRVEAAPREPDAGGALAGLRHLARDRLLRAWTASIVVGDAAWTAIFLALPVLVFVEFGANPRIAGWLIASFGVGALAGNAIAYRAVGRVDGLALVAAVVMFQALPLWTLALPVPPLAVGAALAAAGLANGIVNPSLHSIVTLRPPPGVRARVLTAIITLNMLAAPLALVLTGPALDALGTRTVFAAAAAVQTVAMAVLALAAVRARAVAAPLVVPPASSVS